jgi:hypothetical protein
MPIARHHRLVTWLAGTLLLAGVAVALLWRPSPPQGEAPAQLHDALTGAEVPGIRGAAGLRR